MAENVYEGMFILDTNRYGRDPEAVSGQIQEMIKKADGEMLVSQLWEERKLAYTIKGHRKGTYWLTYFRLDSDRLAEIRRGCQLSDSILRVLFLKVDPRIVDTLVAHAQSARLGSAAAEERHEDTHDAKGSAEEEVPAEAESPDLPDPIGEP